MRRSWTVVIFLGLLAGMLVGCGRGQRPIPAGAQQVHIVVAESEVRLNPATVRAGDLYVVLDTPLSSVAFVERKRTAAEIPGPMSDDDLARLALGDTQGTSIGVFDDTGCSDQQRAEDRGMLGVCGNVFMVVVSAGKYAFLTDDPAGRSGGLRPPRAIAVLEVLP